jgi:hypothetical protein
MFSRYGEYCHALDPALIEMDDPRFVAVLNTPSSLASPLLDLLGVRFVAAGRLEDVPALESRGFSLVFRSDREGIALFENPRALPRAFCVTSCTITGGEGIAAETARGRALARVGAPDFRAGETVVLEAPPPDGFAPAPDPEGRAPEAILEAYDELEVRVSARMHGGRGFLVLTDNAYPGWKAEVDGKAAPLLTADYTFRAVALSEGDHTVVFRYEPASRKAGIGISLGSLGILALAALLLFFRRNPDRA